MNVYWNEVMFGFDSDFIQIQISCYRLPSNRGQNFIKNSILLGFGFDDACTSSHLQASELGVCLKFNFILFWLAASLAHSGSSVGII